MVRHIVIWKALETTTREDLENLKKLSETLLEIKGVVSLDFVIDGIAKTTHDIVLNATYNSLSDLENYQVDPIHVEFGRHLRPLVKERVCFDYEY